MTLKRKKLRALLATMTTELGEVGHRLRHHGKHHEREVWRSATISDVINSSTSTVLDRTSDCYTNNEVLIIIGLTCVLNLAFLAVVVSCVHLCSSSSCHKTSSCDSLMMDDHESSDLEESELENEHKILSPFS